jgi:hypothetical protein
MTEADAKAKDPSAEPVPGSLEVRQVPDNADSSGAGCLMRCMPMRQSQDGQRRKRQAVAPQGGNQGELR